MTFIKPSEHPIFGVGGRAEFEGPVVSSQCPQDIDSVARARAIRAWTYPWPWPRFLANQQSVSSLTLDAPFVGSLQG